MRYDRITLQTFFCSQELPHFLHAFHFLRATVSSHVLPYEKKIVNPICRINFIFMLHQKKHKLRILWYESALYPLRSFPL